MTDRSCAGLALAGPVEGASAEPTVDASKPRCARRPQRKQADVLIDLAAADAPWHAPDGTAYADIERADHRETWPLRSRGYRRVLIARYHACVRGAPSA